MIHRHEDEESREARYDSEMVRKVAALAARLQEDSRETYTLRDMEAIGQEVGLEPPFVRAALAQIVAPRQRRGEVGRNRVVALESAWWASLWTLPFLLPALLGSVDGFERQGIAPAVGFFLGWAIYLGGGTWLSALVRAETKRGKEPRRHSAVPPAAAAPMSRLALVELFFELQRQLEAEKEHRAFLSVDVVGSSEMKRRGSELEVEYSFGCYQRWVEETVRAFGGEVAAAAGDGTMAVFADDRAAIRAARALQEGIGAFDSQYNRLDLPFRLRCGISAGEVPRSSGPLGTLQSPVVDRAAFLQKRAEPGEIVVAEEVASAALRELGQLAAVTEPAGDLAAYRWSPAA